MKLKIGKLFNATSLFDIEKEQHSKMSAAFKENRQKMQHQIDQHVKSLVGTKEARLCRPKCINRRRLMPQKA